jgi:hypothetical protein
MKKAILGALASLMLAGMISAASGLTTTAPSAPMGVTIGDGTAPVNLSADPADNPCDTASQNK